MNREKTTGFTLIEILVSLLIISLSFILIQRTFFILQRNILLVQQKMKNNEIFYKFFTNFRAEINGICDWKNLQLDSKEIILIANLPDFLYPVEITYKIQDTSEGELLIRKQKNFLTEYEYTIPVLNAESIDFLFFIDGEWKYEIESDKKPDGIGVEIYKEGEKIFYPVYLIYERKNE